MADWQSIETVPEEGLVLVYDDGVFVAQDLGAAGAKKWIAMPMGADEYYDTVLEPTHWMPLPEPPVIQP